MLLLIDKPAGMTSHDVVDAVRRITGERRVGHAGTLDPFATGLLVVGVGRESTKTLGEHVAQTKTYEAEIVLGQTTETLDPEGVVTTCADGPTKITRAALEQAIAGLTGEILQTPPMYSALKRGGVKLYTLARRGETLALNPRPVRVDAFTITSPLPDIITLPTTLHATITCGPGTYIRALARDLGAALGSCSYLTALRRTAIGEYRVENAVSLAELAEKAA